MARPIQTYRSFRRNNWRGEGVTWPEYQKTRRSEADGSTDRALKRAAVFIGARPADKRRGTRAQRRAAGVA